MTPRKRVEGRLESVNVSMPERVPFGDKTILTGIDKKPVPGPVMIRRLNLEGDGQADLRVHGGADKAVYVYAQENYLLWRQELRSELPYGHFGDNLTVTGFLEENVHLGDVLRVGDVVLQVTQPRFPCYKLGNKMGDPRFIARFLNSGRSGFYCRVLQEGLVEAGQAIVLIPSANSGPSIAESSHRSASTVIR